MSIHFVTDQMEWHKPKCRGGELVTSTMKRGSEDRHGGYEDMEMGVERKRGVERKVDCGSETLSLPSHTTVHRMNER